ncbi:hypothetical protein [Tetragenococcus muriaticus]|uniref:hypothetical protein n=1 Tax=Tetragenococcus muriaticus TaxID=64642 RepID=UPI000A564BDD|nr:hypothetical protein [Tetragenococcus muriaticus]
MEKEKSREQRQKELNKKYINFNRHPRYEQLHYQTELFQYGWLVNVRDEKELGKAMLNDKAWYCIRYAGVYKSDTKNKPRNLIRIGDLNRVEIYSEEN